MKRSTIYIEIKNKIKTVRRFTFGKNLQAFLVYEFFMKFDGQNAANFKQNLNVKWLNIA